MEAIGEVEENAARPLPPVGTCIIKSYAGICQEGYSPAMPDKPNQDAIVMTELREADAVLLAVFDGHGDNGHVVSSFFRDRIADAVFAHPSFNVVADVADNVTAPDATPAVPPPLKTSVLPAVGVLRKRRNVGAAIKGAMKALEGALLRDASVDCSLSGCTGCVVVVVGGDVTVANVGDSRAMLVRTRPDGVASPGGGGGAGGGGDGDAALLTHALSIDHKPTLVSETRRILLKGGRVRAIKYEDGGEGPVRVWLRDDDLPGLAMSRSLGDTEGKKAAISSDADVYTYTLTRHDAFLIVASDGLWEFTSPADVAGVVSATHARAAAAAAAHAAAVAEQAAQLAALEAEGKVPSEELAAELPPPPLHLQLLLDELGSLANQRWYEREGVMDDTSIIVAEIGTLAAPGAAVAAVGGEVADAAAGGVEASS